MRKRIGREAYLHEHTRIKCSKFSENIKHLPGIFLTGVFKSPFLIEDEEGPGMELLAMFL